MTICPPKEKTQFVVDLLKFAALHPDHLTTRPIGNSDVIGISSRHAAGTTCQFYSTNAPDSTEQRPPNQAQLQVLVGILDRTQPLDHNDPWYGLKRFLDKYYVPPSQPGSTRSYPFDPHP